MWTGLSASFCSTPLSLDAYRKKHVATQAEADAVLHQVELIDADILAANEAVEALQLAYKSAWSRAHQLVMSRERYNALLAPVRKLPFELLSEIFLWYNAIEGQSAVHNPALILKLGWVCSQWRDVAVGTHRLWTRIQYPGERKNMSSDATFIRDIWLPRTGNLPLSVDLCWRQGEMVQRTLETLLMVSKRWQNASITLADATMGSDQVGLLDLQLVRSVAIYNRSGQGSASITGFKAADNLTDVHLDGQISTDLPWSRLLNVSIANQTGTLRYPATHCHFLPLCKRLKSWKTHRVLLAQSVFDGTHFYAHVLCNTLEVLHTTFDCRLRGERRSAVGLWTPFTFPSLIELALTFMHPRRILWDQQAFAAFLERSKCNIRTLSLENANIRAHDLVDALSMMPTIEWLCLKDVFEGDGADVFTSLTYPDIGDAPSAQPAVLPVLQTLGIDFQTWTIHSPSLVQMIWSRVHEVPVSAAIDSDIASKRTRLRTFAPMYATGGKFGSHPFDAWAKAGLEIVRQGLSL